MHGALSIVSVGLLGHIALLEFTLSFHSVTGILLS